jgi:dihydroflavonol-4-reductase
LNLVTGATGIVGSHVLLTLLRANSPVIACKQKNSDVLKVKQLFSYYVPDYAELFEKIKWVDMDMRDLFSIEDALEGIETVYHCAGYVSFNRHHQKQLMDVNHIGTQLMVNACLRQKTKAFCYVSSIATINNLDYKDVLNEDVFWKTSGNESAYAISKYNAEREVWRGIEEGLNAVIVNPGMILSPGFWGQSSSMLFNRCYKGNRFYTLGTTGYVAAADVAEIMIQLVEGHKFGNRYILVAENYTFKDVIEKVNKNFNNPLPTIKANSFMLNVAWVFDSVASFILGNKSTLTRSIIHASASNQLYSSQKVKMALGYTFSDITKIMEDICLSYRKEKSKSNTNN